jgi:methanogenic corrinoid protein MtbC1
MYNVHDLGINVTPEKFVNEALNVKAEIIGVSSMMVHTTLGEEGALGVRKILKERGLESRIKLIVGGAPYRFDPELYKKVNADGWSDNAIEVVSLVDTLIGKMRAE